MPLSAPKVMGILNITPDSFYEGSRTNSLDIFLKKAENMLTDGATFLDIGGYSSRPGATDISEKEEKQRVLPYLKELKKNFPDALVSIDTFRANVAKECLDLGADLINDVSGGSLDSEMYELVSKYKVPYILMHMRGTPQNMIEKAQYSNVTQEVIKELSEKVYDAKEAGIRDIIIDPGFGFAKRMDKNFELFGSISQLKVLECPLLVGISRKSMIYKTLNIDAEDALNGTTVLNTVALLSGTKILRVHDVKEAIQSINLVEKIIH